MAERKEQLELNEATWIADEQVIASEIIVDEQSQKWIEWFEAW